MKENEPDYHILKRCSITLTLSHFSIDELYIVLTCLLSSIFSRVQILEVQIKEFSRSFVVDVHVVIQLIMECFDDELLFLLLHQTLHPHNWFSSHQYFLNYKFEEET